MAREIENPGAPETVSLQNAVLCVDCELVTSSTSDRCPVCGSHSLLDLAGMVGGRLLDYKGGLSRSHQLFLFNLHITIDMPHMEAGELSTTIEGISGLIAPKLGRNRASLRINVEPVASSSPVKLKAA